jgi:(E)-4-hydroxy-3-methylbut-2-enyl-diphosphate synthase
MIEADKDLPYCDDLFNRKRFKTRQIKIGNLTLGGDAPIRVQSMTTTDTMDTEGSVAQSIRMIDAGCELVRLTAPSKNDALNLRNIKDELVKRGYDTPLVADIHFTPNAAEIAAGIVEKVRVNPGNYADKKKFEEHNYTDEAYGSELERIEQKFTPLVLLCKEKGTAMRIGTNHGSLSDRILSRYGDTPEGMVESAMEFIRICRKHDYHELVISMKASNTLVMVQAYRLLVATMKEEGMAYPLHLGVTEAGDGEDGRIKSAVGIGALLEDGLGDTIRVSLTEEPEFEIPVAQKLAERYSTFTQHVKENSVKDIMPYSPYHYKRRETNSILNIGHGHVPVVIADLSQKSNITPSNFFGFGYNYSKQLDKWHIQDQAADYVYIGKQDITFELPGTLSVLVDSDKWEERYMGKIGYYPVYDGLPRKNVHSDGIFIRLSTSDIDWSKLSDFPNAIIIVTGDEEHSTNTYRNFIFNFAKYNTLNPIVWQVRVGSTDVERFQLHASAMAGIMLIDGFGDGIWIDSEQPTTIINSTSFGILQATRTRISKTEYISCPSCGRTLFDLQETTAKIRARTSHLKGIKIGIMGCIVNGPGEMADADYGYVGTGPGKIHLYKEKTVVRKNVEESFAVEALIELIKENGDWIEPNT